jgi:hypothetical protein
MRELVANVSAVTALCAVAAASRVVDRIGFRAVSLRWRNAQRRRTAASSRNERRGRRSYHWRTARRTGA